VTRKGRPKAGALAKAAEDALSKLRLPDPQPRTLEEAANYATPHDRYAQALKAEIAGLSRSLGRLSGEDSIKTDAKYRMVIAEFKRTGHAQLLAPPFCDVTIAIVMEELFGSSSVDRLEELEKFSVAFRRYLQRHPEL
jgi:hypothetical protein